MTNLEHFVTLEHWRFVKIRDGVGYFGTIEAGNHLKLSTIERSIWT